MATVIPSDLYPNNNKGIITKGFKICLKIATSLGKINCS